MSPLPAVGALTGGTVAVDRLLEDTRALTPRAIPLLESRRRALDYVVDVSRPSVPWRWTDVLLLPVELLLLAWSIPFVILLIGMPVALAAAAILWVGRFVVNSF